MMDSNPVFAEIVDVDKSFTNDLISKIIKSSKNNNELIKTVVLFYPEGHIIELPKKYIKYDHTSYTRVLKSNHGYLHFQYRRDADIYFLFKKLIGIFLKKNPAYQMVGDEFGIIKWCWFSEVVFEFAIESEFVEIPN